MLIDHGREEASVTESTSKLVISSRRLAWYNECSECRQSIQMLCDSLSSGPRNPIVNQHVTMKCRGLHLVLPENDHAPALASIGYGHLMRVPGAAGTEALPSHDVTAACMVGRLVAKPVPQYPLQCIGQL